MNVKTRDSLALIGIAKSFGGVMALHSVDFHLRRGEIHALVGENGAGKSTLVKVICGIYCPDKGQILVDGKKVLIDSPKKAEAYGIAVVPQDIQLVPTFTALENIALGHEQVRMIGVPDWLGMRDTVEKLMVSLGIDLPLDTPVGLFALADQQMICILRALMRKAHIFLLDEPTSSIAIAETKRLFPIVRKLGEEGCSVLYISHRLEEIFELADQVTILRDGMVAKSVPIRDISMKELVATMTGDKETAMERKGKEAKTGEALLSLRNVGGTIIRGIGFEVRRGEVLGITGLVGSGLEELVDIMYGVQSPHKGGLQIKQKDVVLSSPAQAIKLGICLVPENRLTQGLVVEMSVRENSTLSSLRKVSTRMGIISTRPERAKVKQIADELRIVTPSMEQPVKYLSGGNQQKVVIAKVLLTEAEVYVFHQPTKGVDIGAKSEIWRLVRELISKDKAVVVVSTDVREILAISSRILVMQKGRIRYEIDPNEASESQILLMSSGEWSA